VPDKAKAADLAKQLKSGAEFAAMAKRYPAPALTQIRRYDNNLSSAIREAVFAARPGENTRPVAQPDGVYVFRVLRVTPQAYSEVSAYAAKAVSDERYQSWITSVTQSVTVK
jgi:hypothetical protein